MEIKNIVNFAKPIPFRETNKQISEHRISLEDEVAVSTQAGAKDSNIIKRFGKFLSHAFRVKEGYLA